uniref:PB1-like domain-containing protein n=1 Tax=Setaria italica TaxID=4555 RepID=K3ZCW6_SETIT
MALTLWRKTDPAPSYGDNPDEFTIKVHHGGFFVGFGHLRSFVNGKVSCFDHCEVDTWSTLWLDDMVENLGYPKTPNLKYYWLLPRKKIAGGLRVIVGDADTNAMCSVVDRIKNLVVYLDHDDTVISGSWDDVIVNPIAELPEVPSPVKNNDREKLPEFYRNLSPCQSTHADEEEDNISDQDSEDSNFFDSDNEVDDGDDDLFVDYVDEDVMDEGIFGSKNTARAKKAKGSRLKGVEHLLIAELLSDDDYEELLLSSDDRDAQVWVLKKYTANWLVDKYLESFRANDKMSIFNFTKTVQKDWNLTPSRTKPLICLDGCYIETKVGGQILTVVGIDPNDCIYPIVLATVEVESKDTWKWFLETLKQDLGIVNTYPWTVMTNNQMDT